MIFMSKAYTAEYIKGLVKDLAEDIESSARKLDSMESSVSSLEERLGQCERDIKNCKEGLINEHRAMITDAVNEHIEKIVKEVAIQLAKEMKDKLLVELAKNALSTNSTQVLLENHVPERNRYGGYTDDNEYY